MPNSSKIFKDWKKDGHGEVDLVKAIAVSCDTFFYGLGIELGIPKLNEVLKRFGFGEKTNIDIPNEKKGLIANAEWKKKKFNKKWYQGETAITAIGQGYTLAESAGNAYAPRTARPVCPRTSAWFTINHFKIMGKSLAF